MVYVHCIRFYVKTSKKQELGHLHTVSFFYGDTIYRARPKGLGQVAAGKYRQKW